jgi:hypothetical protein
MTKEEASIVRTEIKNLKLAKYKIQKEILTLQARMADLDVVLNNLNNSLSIYLVNQRNFQ